MQVSTTSCMQKLLIRQSWTLLFGYLCSCVWLTNFAAHSFLAWWTALALPLRNSAAHFLAGLVGNRFLHKIKLTTEGIDWFIDSYNGFKKQIFIRKHETFLSALLVFTAHYLLLESWMRVWIKASAANFRNSVHTRIRNITWKPFLFLVFMLFLVLWYRKQCYIGSITPDLNFNISTPS